MQTFSPTSTTFVFSDKIAASAKNIPELGEGEKWSTKNSFISIRKDTKNSNYIVRTRTQNKLAVQMALIMFQGSDTKPGYEQLCDQQYDTCYDHGNFQHHGHHLYGHILIILDLAVNYPQFPTMPARRPDAG